MSSLFSFMFTLLLFAIPVVVVVVAVLFGDGVVLLKLYLRHISIMSSRSS